MAANEGLEGGMELGEIGVKVWVVGHGEGDMREGGKEGWSGGNEGRSGVTGGGERGGRGS